MLKIAALLLLIPCLTFAQKKDDKQKSDTLSVELKASESELLAASVQQYNQILQQMQQLEQRKQEVQATYTNLLRMKVEAVGGDSKKYFDLKGTKLYYLKP
jgi:hypothetical protein